MHCSEMDDVVFVEETVPSAQIISHAQYKLHDGLFSQSQLKNLNDVKRKLAALVKKAGGNCLINFRYGQKSTFWSTLFGTDKINWFGEGDIARISQENLTDLLQESLDKR